MEQATGRKPFFTVGFLLIIAIFGIYLRFTTKTENIFWYDESYIMMHASGYKVQDVVEKIENKVMTADAVKKQFLQPDANVKYKDIAAAITYDNPGQVPLLNVAAQQFSSRFGPENLRLLPFAFGMLTILFAFWFGFEISGSLLGGLIAAALTSISPFLISQSQSLTQAALLPALVCATSAALLRATKSSTIVCWILYFCLAAVSLMSSTLIICTLIAHVLFVISSSRSRFRKGFLLVPKNLGYCVLSFLCILAIYFPVVAVQVTHNVYTLMLTPYVGDKVTMDVLLNSWLTNPLSVFLMNPDNSPLANFLLITLLSIAISCFVLDWAFGKRKSVLLLLMVCLLSVIYFWVPDAVFGGQRTLTTKFWVAIPICVLMAVSYAITLAYRTNKIGLKLIGPLFLVFAVGCQIFSVYKNSGVREPNMVDEQSLTKVTEAVSKSSSLTSSSVTVSSPATLVFSRNIDSTNVGQMLALSEAVDPQTKFVWLSASKPMKLDPAANLFVFNPDDQTFKNLRAMGLRLAPVDKLNFFFRATKDELL